LKATNILLTEFKLDIAENFGNYSVVPFNETI